MTAENAWRPAIAALVNDTAREVYARVVLGASASEAVAGLPVARARSAVATLVASGLLIERDGELSADTGALKRMLAAAPARPTGVERFLRPDGRIDRYPTKATEREELLAHVGARALAPGEVVTERELTDRLAAFADDVALLRRQLVDHGIVERTPSGSEYALARPREPLSAAETQESAETSRQAPGSSPNAMSQRPDAESRATSSGRR